MVDLPQVPRGNVISLAPRTAVSPGEVAAPYQELANNLDKIGEAAGNVSEQQAEAAGHNAVRTDDQGNYVVDKAPYILGQASQGYARAARYEYLTKVTPEIQDKITQARLDHANDPAGLKAATDAYTKEVTSKVSDPALRGPVERVASEAASQAYRTALVSTDATTRSNALTGMTSQLATINEQSTALARQEGGIDTPEYKRLAQDRAALYKELGGDPRFGYPKERIEQELKANRDEDVVQYKIGQVVREYKTKQNGAEAKQALQDAFWGEGSEKLGLSIHKRDAAVTEGMRALASMTAEEKAGTQENRAMTSEYIQGLKDAPNSFNEIRHNDVRAQAVQFHDDKLVAELDATKTLIPLMQWAKGANEAEGTAMLDAAAKGTLPGIPSMLSKSQQLVSDVIAHAEVVGHGFGIDPATGKPIRTGYDQTVSGQTFNTDEFQGQHPYESGRFRPYVYTSGPHAGQISTASGRGQETLTTYRESARNYGVTGFTPAAQDARTFYKAEDLYKKSDPASRFPGATGNLEKDVEKFGTDPNFWSRAFAPAAAKEWTSVPGGEQPNDSTRTWIANAVSLSSGQGPQVGPSGSFAKGVGGFAPGERIASQPIAVQRLFQSTVTSMRAQVAKQAQASADTIVKTIEKGDTLAPNELGDFAHAAEATGQTAELLPKVEAALRANKAATEAENEGQVTALRAQIADIKASGADPIARGTLDQLTKQLDLNQKRWKEDPLTAGDLAHQIKPINQIDFTNPGAAAQELKERDGKMKVLKQLHPQIPQTAPIIGAGEGKVIANALISGPVDQADGFLKAASQSLSPETFQATMASPEMKNALQTMSRSSDPARMAAGMAALDKLWQGNSPGFAAIYGTGTQQRMLAFNAMRGEFPPEEIAERLSKADDPAQAKAREEQGTLVDKEMAKVKDPVTTLMGNFFQRQFPSFVPAVEFSQGRLDAPAAGTMVAEYTANLKALRMYGVDHDKAAELAQQQLQKDWKPSDVAGGRIMKNRPEDFYPAINGSHEWMRGGLEADLEGAFGPRETTVNTALGPQTSYNWTVKAMVPDKQTEAEIAAHRPPSYQVIVTRNGMDEAYRDPKTGNNRIAFDPTPHQAAYDKGFVSLDQYRKRVQQLRAEGADTGFVINTDKPTSILPTPAGLPVTTNLGTRG
jgi:muramidase (phage lysozyme)